MYLKLNNSSAAAKNGVLISLYNMQIVTKLY